MVVHFVVAVQVIFLLVWIIFVYQVERTALARQSILWSLRSQSSLILRLLASLAVAILELQRRVRSFVEKGRLGALES